MSDATGNALVPQPVDARIAGDWRAFFDRGEVFAVPTNGEQIRRRLAVNTVVLVVFWTVVLAAIVGAVVLAFSEFGRELTYILLILLALVAAAAALRIVMIRRRLVAIRDAPEEYIAISKTGVRFAGAELPWDDVVAGLILDEREVRHAGFKRLTAKLMLAAGYPSVEMQLGVRAGTAGEYRGRARGALRKLYMVTLGNGAVRIPLSYAVEDDSIDAVTTAVRVSGADAGAPIVYTLDQVVLRAAVKVMWSGERPGGKKE